ncbi:MAG: MBL fold metallo-hydrolase [Syntrophobacteraceae bacterium]
MERKEDARAKGWVPAIVKNIETEHSPNDENEPEAPGWIFLSELFQQQDPLSKNMLFLEGYDFTSNIYMIVGESLTIIDPGSDYTAFMQLFQQPEYAPDDIRKIVLTHGHPDHALGAIELFRYPAVRENPQLEIILHADGPVELKRIIREFGVPLTEVRGGETLDLSGFQWKVIPTPGHTIDGISLYHALTKTLISGDMVPYSMTAPDREGGERMDQYLVSMRSLLSLDIADVLPGHGPPIASAGKKVLEESYSEVLLKILGSGAEESSSWLEIASAAANRGLHQDAVICCDMAMSIHPEQYRASKLKAFCLNDLGEYDRALEAFNLLEKSSPLEKDDVFTIMGRGSSFLGLGRYDEGLRCFDRVLETMPDNKEALVYKTFAIHLSGRVDEAMQIEEFKKGFIARFKEELLRYAPSENTGNTESP